MSYSLFANKNIHTVEIELFQRVNPSGCIHTTLTTFPSYVRSTPSIFVYDSRSVIQGSENVIAFLQEREPKKEKSVRTPRLQKERVPPKAGEKRTSVLPGVGEKRDTSAPSANIVNNTVEVLHEKVESRADILSDTVSKSTIEDTVSTEPVMQPLKKPRRRSSKPRKTEQVSTS
jgi:hypothetical protein